MITCTITIKEAAGGKGFMLDMNPEQEGATPREMEIAGIIDYLMKPVFDSLLASVNKGEMIESKDVEAVRQIIEAKAKRLFGENPI